MQIQLTSLAALALTLFLGSCASGGFFHRGDPEVDDELLAYVPQDEREQIAQARTASAQREGDLTVAESEVEKAEADLRRARQEMDVIEQEMDAAKMRDDRPVTDDQLHDESHPSIERVRAERRYVEARIELAELQVAAAKAKRDLVEKELELADRQIELRKAKAVSSLDRPESRKIDINAYESSVSAVENELRNAEIDLEAAQRKVESQQEQVDQLSQEIDQEGSTQEGNWQGTRQNERDSDDDDKDEGN